MANRTISVIYHKELDNRLYYINNISTMFRKPVYQTMFLGLATLLTNELLKVLNEKCYELRAIYDDYTKMDRILKFIDERNE